MKDAASVIEKVNEKEKSKQFLELYDRQDDDYAIYISDLTSKAYTALRETYDETINIPCPDPRAYADEIIDLLVRAQRAIAIHTAEQKGSDERENISDLERLFDFALTRGDVLLQNKGLIPLKDSLVWYGAIRGYSAARILNYLNDKRELIADYLPLDPRWLTYEYGENQLLWAGYKTFRSEHDLIARYDYTPKKQTAEVIEYWEHDGEKASNAVVCDGEFLKKPTDYPLPSIPIIILPVATRPVVVDREGIRVKGYGDSIFATSRQIIPIINQLFTLWATYANVLANAPWVQSLEEGTEKLEKIYSKINTVIGLPKGSEISKMDLGEIPGTLVNLLQFLLEMWQRATKPFISFGQADKQWSGTAIDLLQSGEEKAYGPVLRSLDAMYTAICYKIEEQINAGGLKFEIEGVGRDKEYFKQKISPVTVKRPHIIKVEHIVESRYGKMSKYQLARMAKDMDIPDEYIWETILKIQDPKMLDELRAMEKTEKDPIMVLLKAAYGYHKLGRFDKEHYVLDLMERLGSQGGAMPQTSPAGAESGFTPEMPPMPPTMPRPSATTEVPMRGA